jgi:peptide alpha-N-acetyltransferase
VLSSEKYVLALRCLRAAVALSPEAPKVHEQTIAFLAMLKSSPELDPKVRQLLDSELSKITDAKADPKGANDKFFAEHKLSPCHVLASVRARRTLGADLAQCEKELMGILEMKEISFKDAIAVLETLQEWHSSQLPTFKQAAKSRWPEVTRLG